MLFNMVLVELEFYCSCHMLIQNYYYYCYYGLIIVGFFKWVFEEDLEGMVKVVEVVEVVEVEDLGYLKFKF